MNYDKGRLGLCLCWTYKSPGLGIMLGTPWELYGGHWSFEIKAIVFKFWIIWK